MPGQLLLMGTINREEETSHPDHKFAERKRSQISCQNTSQVSYRYGIMDGDDFRDMVAVVDTDRALALEPVL